MKKFFIIAGFFLGCIFIPHLSFADYPVVAWYAGIGSTASAGEQQLIFASSSFSYIGDISLKMDSYPPPPSSGGYGGLFLYWNCTSNGLGNNGSDSNGCNNGLGDSWIGWQDFTDSNGIRTYHFNTAVSGMVEIVWSNDYRGGSITVEGSNVSTTTLVSFGQGLGGSQPYPSDGYSGFMPWFSITGVSGPALAPPGPSLKFVFPTDGTTTPNFTNYILQLSGNVTSTDSCYVVTEDFVPQVTGLRTLTPQTFPCGWLQNSGIAVYKPTFGITVPNDATSSPPIIARGFVYDVTDFQIPDNLDNFLIASATVEYQIIPIQNTAGSNPNATTTILNTSPWLNASGTFTGNAAITVSQSAAPVPSVTSATFNCPTPSGITDIGGGVYWGLCNVAALLLVPNTSLTEYLTTGFQNFQQAFPFSVVFGIHTILTQNISTAVSSGTAVIALTMPSFVPDIGGRSMTLVGSSTLKNAVGAQNFSEIFALEDALMWIFEAYLVYEIITK
jgi:hypothetical protein